MLLFCCLDLGDGTAFLDLGTKSGFDMEIGALFGSNSSDDESEDDELSLDDDAPLPLLDDEELLVLLLCNTVQASCGSTAGIWNLDVARQSQAWKLTPFPHSTAAPRY